MRLFIAEKPSLGRAIADVLPKPLKKSEGFITASNGDVVSWCIGHLLELEEPEGYNPEFKKWAHGHLPIVPQQWKLKPKRQTAKQLGVLRKLVKQATELVHAGDPDREGQLLVDEVISFFGVTGTKKDRMQRCLISDLNSSAVSKAIKKLRSNKEFVPLSTSALARSRADWLYGMNLTRAYTLQGKQAGYKGVLSVGRVQTPVLGLVVRRDQAIRDFISKPFYEVWANLKTETEDTFKAKWKPSQHCEKFLDEQGRNLSRPLAENVASRISHQPAQVSDIKRQQKQQAAPLPYNLSALQIDASKAFGLNAKKVLDICQDLYEKHKVITYPRSDCRYLPVEHFSQSSYVVTAITQTIDQINQHAISNLPLNLKQKSKTWNDAKVSAHHAIIPTLKKSSSLSKQEKQIYGLISRNYLAQFLPAYEFSTTQVEVTIGTGKFYAKAKETTVEGWKIIFPTKKQNTDDEHTEPEQRLPELMVGQVLQSLQADILEKFTTPPKPYTDATLLAAMTGISAHVSNPDIKKVLKETDGLGTEATRANIIELLFKRNFLQRQGKTVVATAAGTAFINALPLSATTPDMTAVWESQLASIAEGKGQYAGMMQPLESQIREMILESRNIIPRGLEGLGAPKKPRRFKLNKTKKRQKN